MAVTSHSYTRLADTLTAAGANLGTDTLKVALMSAYTPAVDTHQFWADVKAAGTELVAAGYTAGGVTLASVALSDTGHVRTLTCANPNWANLSGSPTHAVFYDSTPATDATRPVLVYWDFGGAVSPGGQSFTLQINASGLLTMTGSG